MKTKKVRGVPVVRIDPVTGKERVFKSAAEAARVHGLDQMNISQVCRRVSGWTTHGGFEWEYVNGLQARWPGPFAGRRHSEETRQKMSAAKDPKKRPVAQFTKGGTLLCVFPSVTAAARAIGSRTASNICEVARGNRQHYRGLVYRYA